MLSMTFYNDINPIRAFPFGVLIVFSTNTIIVNHQTVKGANFKLLLWEECNGQLHRTNKNMGVFCHFSGCENPTEKWKEKRKVIRGVGEGPLKELLRGYSVHWQQERERGWNWQILCRPLTLTKCDVPPRWLVWQRRDTKWKIVQCKENKFLQWSKNIKTTENVMIPIFNRHFFPKIKTGLLRPTAFVIPCPKFQ